MTNNFEVGDHVKFKHNYYYEGCNCIVHEEMYKGAVAEVLPHQDYYNNDKYCLVKLLKEDYGFDNEVVCVENLILVGGRANIHYDKIKELTQ